MSFLRWFFSGIVVSLLIVLVGVFGNGDTFVSRATAEDTAKPYHGNITKIEKTYTRVEFDLSKKTHLLRKSRMDYYIAQAKQADKRGWDYKRDQMLERVENMLAHHLTQYAQESDATAVNYASAR